FLIAGLLLVFQTGWALSAPNWTVHYNMNYGDGTIPQQTADLYLLNRASILSSCLSMAVRGRLATNPPMRVTTLSCSPWRDFTWYRSIIVSRAMVIPPRSGTRSCRMCNWPYAGCARMRVHGGWIPTGSAP